MRVDWELGNFARRQFNLISVNGVIILFMGLADLNSGHGEREIVPFELYLFPRQ